PGLQSLRCYPGLGSPIGHPNRNAVAVHPIAVVSIVAVFAVTPRPSATALRLPPFLIRIPG
ncbi:MAG: hypothetical protein ACKPGI_13530, partial [Verrucomicrobiota bacterium]